MPSDTVFYITDVCIPHSWMTVEYDINNRMYFQISILDNTTYYIATMNQGVYNGDEYAAELNAAITSANSSVVTNNI